MGTSPIGPNGPHDDTLEPVTTKSGAAAKPKKENEEIGPNGPHAAPAPPTQPADASGPNGPHNS
jgi:hypothetical protein